MSLPHEPESTRSDVERHRQRLLAVATEEFSRNPEASMAEIAQAAELTRATVYRHFSNRQTLLKAIQAEALARATEALISCRLDEGSALEVLQRVIASLSSQGMRFRVILMRAPELNPSFLKQRARVLAPLADVIARGQAEGDIRSDLSTDWILTAMVSLLIAAVRAAPTTRISGGDISVLIYQTLVGGIGLNTAVPEKQN